MYDRRRSEINKIFGEKNEIEKLNKIPLVLAEILEEHEKYDCIEVACPYCSRPHQHNLIKPYSKDIITHRGSHCCEEDRTKESSKGYFIGLN